MTAASVDPSAPDTAATDTAATWSVVVPVKPAAEGKSRLGEAGADRTALARAVALDTVAAAAAADRVAEVIVVTDDVELSAAVRGMTGVRVIAETERAGLDAAVAAGMRAAAPGPHAALLGDLPALRPSDLDAALAAAEGVERGVVADAEGTGSTLVTARAGAVWLSAFGEGSAERHRLLGCVELETPADSTLRRDVDTVEHLARASDLGLGPRTTAVLAAAVA
jgi:2-phospho-L-lactate/phosphoenolpyruvate guanylyltransferase